MTSAFALPAPCLRAAGVAALLLLGLACIAQPRVAQAHAIEPASRLDFVPPAPGSYVLHRIMAAPDGSVLDLQGKSARLSSYTRDKVTLLSFVYTSCVDACPYALAVLNRLHAQISKAPAMRGRVRMVSLSFDPEHDTPATMRQYRTRAAEGAGGLRDWHFLTTASPRHLVPLLEGFGQYIVPVEASAAGPARDFEHVLKLFLIDRKGQIREIYTTSFLIPELMLNDIKTLLMEDGARFE